LSGFVREKFSLNAMVAVLFKEFVEGLLSKVRSIFDTIIYILIFCAILVLIVALDRLVFTDQRLLSISQQAR